MSHAVDRSQQRRRLSLGIVLVCLLVLSGCAPSLKQLQAFKQHGTAADYAWIAAQDVQCQAQTEGCNQLHLIKGNACFVLAKQGQESARHYACAADHLEQGVRLTTQWSQEGLDLNQAQTYENLCEALRNLQDMQRGDVAKITGERFAAAAEAFARAEPGHTGAVYYLAKARFRLLQPSLPMVTDRNRQQVCERLASLLQPVEAVLAQAQQQPAALWQRYEANYRLLKGEVGTVQHTLLKCP